MNVRELCDVAVDHHNDTDEVVVQVLDPMGEPVGSPMAISAVLCNATNNTTQPLVLFHQRLQEAPKEALSDQALANAIRNMSSDLTKMITEAASRDIVVELRHVVRKHDLTNTTTHEITVQLTKEL